MVNDEPSVFESLRSSYTSVMCVYHFFSFRCLIMAMPHNNSAISLVASFLFLVTITKTCLVKYTENFITKINEKFQIKNSDIFHIFVVNIDCGYSTRRF